MNRRWQKRGFIWRAESVADWWDACTQAPAPICLGDGRIRVFVGAWKTGGVRPLSRIGYLDVDARNPAKILDVGKRPVVDIGLPGTYNDSGVFPSHALRLDDGRIFLYVTGFQQSSHESVDHFNFSGLAISEDNGSSFKTFGNAPVLDRADEGLHIRAGLSAWQDGDEGFHCVYSAGSGFSQIDGKLRARYDVYYQYSFDGVSFKRQGRRIILSEPAIEHAWGRPQLVRINGGWSVFAARRILGGRYCIGHACSSDLQEWRKNNKWTDSISLGEPESFDEQMVYYPAICLSQGKTYLFYCGNQFGLGGLGYAELV